MQQALLIGGDLFRRPVQAAHLLGGQRVEPAGDAGVHAHDHGRTTGDDAGEQDDGDAVADAELGDLLTQPHDEGGAGHKGGHDDHTGPDAVHAAQVQQAVGLDEGVVAEALKQCNTHGGVAGDGRNLLPALLAAVLLETLQGGDGDGEELDDDGAVDIGLDGQCEYRCRTEAAAAHGVHQAENGAAHTIQIGPQSLGVHKGHGHGGAQPENQQSKDGEEDLLAQLFNFPGVFDGLDHVRPPPPFRRQPRSSPWRRRRKRWHGRSAFC